MYGSGNEAYTLPRQTLPEMHPAIRIQGADSIPHFAAESEQPIFMYNEGIPEFFIDNSYYYPATTGFDCISTGYESTGDWEDHYGAYAVEGQDIQYSAMTNENLPYLYYTPSYGYSLPSYTIYDSYTGGALVGGDGLIAAPQQYHTIPTHTESVLLPTYVPVIIQSRAEANTRNALEANVLVAKQKIAPTSNSSLASAVEISSHRNSRVNIKGSGAINTGSGKQQHTNGVSDGSKYKSSSQAAAPWGASPQSKGSSESSQLIKGGLTSSREENPSKTKYKKVLKNNSSSLNSGQEKKLQNNLVVKVYTKRAGNPDAEGNITIFKDQYNSDHFPVDHVNAKFFVIKSYSEDDVHKSVKYNVWSSTPGGNKRLSSAFEDAQRIATGECPIFLFFSVNASGQFCGVAEMTGPVNFNRDMDFWQQDKWSGSFPVKWHIIKDVPNHNFRHIILENNEGKSVTNSRDTQEIPRKKGLEMLRIFRDAKAKTSLLDDFMYYEDRQRILFEERRRRTRIIIPQSNGQHLDFKNSTESRSSSTSSTTGTNDYFPSNIVTIGSMAVPFNGSPSFPT